MILDSTYVFYGDVYFVWNYLIKATTLILIVKSFRKRVEVSVRKIILLAGVASLIEIIGLCFLPNYVVFVVFVNLFEIPFLMYLLLYPKQNMVGKGVIRAYLFTIIVNGVLEIMWNQFGKLGSYYTLIIMACIIVLIGFSIYCNTCNREKGVFVIELTHMGKRIEIKGFYDSGNCLRDPYTGKGVHIISEKIVEEFMLKEMNKVLIPYQALGTSADLIEVVYIDEIVIYGEKDIVRQHKIPFGIAKEEMFIGKSYKMILNEEVF